MEASALRCGIRAVALLVGLAAMVTPLGRAQAQVAGDWIATLHIGSAELRVVLHISGEKDGPLTATLDLIDLGILGVQANAISLHDSKLDMTVNAMQATYTGTVNKQATEIDGTWTRKTAVELNFRRATAAEVAPPLAPAPAAPTDIDGTWAGVLALGDVKLRIRFQIANTQNGLMARVQSPDQSPVWIPATSVKRNGSSLTIQITLMGAVFEGKITGDLGTIDGTFTQMGNALPLELQRLTD